MPELPARARGLLVAAPLALLVLDLALLAAGGLKVALADPARDRSPQPAALPLALRVGRRDRDLLLGARHVRERARARVLGRRVPEPLNGVRGGVGAVRRERRLELVRFAREVATALVLDLHGSDQIRLGRTPLDVGAGHARSRASRRPTGCATCR
jgi:hypothetical protein